MKIVPTDKARLATRSYPKGSTPIMEQQWRHLLFLHWEYEEEELQKTLPPGLYVDKFQGKAYVGVIPFSIPKINLKFLPPIPGLSHFLELNLRTYVYDESGLPGIWFYSLDANHYLAVHAAKLFFYLPYRYAKIDSFTNDTREIVFNCRRKNTDFNSTFRYQPQSQLQLQLAKEQTLEFFLLERYFLFTYNKDHLVTCRVYHKPYSFCYPQVFEWDDRLFELENLSRPNRKPNHLLFSPGVDVQIFPPQHIRK